MRYYPIFLDIKGRPVLVIGGGNIALEKIENLLKAGADITVISPEISASIRRFNRRLRLIERPFEMADLSTHYLLIFAATGESDLNAAVSLKCRELRVLCNTVDEPAYCHYIIPAIVRRGLLTVAVSTSGVSPLLAKTIKA
ncbi:bifunctional precorrin-2 dehydrogenase/sirohydrochlorin ferrochelatase, partial [bacterium]|nr:bifunctional precorrin-2 dehydrogenase/sirohydrochlorin ferrochelatase [bacterium]